MILEWKPLLNYGVTPPVALVVEYSVFFTQDLDANLESSCLMNEEVYQTNDYHRLTTKDLTKTIGLKQGQRYRVNVVGVVKEGEDTGTIYPYEQIEVYVDDPNSESFSDSPNI